MKTKLKLINDAFERLSWAFDSSWRNYANELFELCQSEEKEHRGCLPEFTRCHTSDTITVNQAAKLFAVKRVAEYLLPGAKPLLPRDYLHCQKSAFLAAGMADEFRDKIMEAWKPFDLVELDSLSYTEFVKVNNAAQNPQN